MEHLHEPLRNPGYEERNRIQHYIDKIERERHDAHSHVGIDSEGRLRQKFTHYQYQQRRHDSVGYEYESIVLQPTFKPGIDDYGEGDAVDDEHHIIAHQQ